MVHDVKDKWWLVTMDALTTAGVLPPHAPAPHLIRALAPGDSAELLFCRHTTRADDETRAEYLWVEVTEVSGPDYCGLLDNQPHYIRGLDHGAAVRFDARHIAGVLYRDKKSAP